MTGAHVCVMESESNYKYLTFLSSFSALWPVERPRPFRACHVCLNNSVSVSLKADLGAPIFLLPLKHDSEDQISHPPYWPSV